MNGSADAETFLAAFERIWRKTRDATTSSEKPKPMLQENTVPANSRGAPGSQGKKPSPKDGKKTGLKKGFLL